MKNYEMRVFPKKADDGTAYWTATFPSIPGCIGGGDTPEEAMNEAQENLEIYLEFLKDECRKIPNEDFKDDYSGKIALRISKSTHRKIAEMSDAEGVSINTLLVSAIENYIGTKTFDMNINKKIDDLKMVADSSLELQQCNAQLNQYMWDDIKTTFNLITEGETI